MLLQTTSDPLAEQDAGMNSAKVEFEVTPVSMMASAFDVPVDRVAMFDVELQLTAAQACMAPAELQNALRMTLVDYLEESASSFLTAQVTSLEVDLGDEQCAGNARRNVRKLLAGYSSATAAIKMLIVFQEGSASTFNQEKFAAMEGVNSVVADARNSPKIAISNELDCTGSKCGEVDSRSDSSSSSGVSTALIAGIAGGVAGVLVLGLGAWLLMRKREPETVAAVQTINVSDLKSQLADDV